MQALDEATFYYMIFELQQLMISVHQHWLLKVDILLHVHEDVCEKRNFSFEPWGLDRRFFYPVTYCNLSLHIILES